MNDGLQAAHARIAALEKSLASLCDAHEEQFVRADKAEAQVAAQRVRLAQALKEIEELKKQSAARAWEYWE